MPYLEARHRKICWGMTRSHETSSTSFASASNTTDHDVRAGGRRRRPPSKVYLPLVCVCENVNVFIPGFMRKRARSVRGREGGAHERIEYRRL